jgi:hypothetical protein
MFGILARSKKANNEALPTQSMKQKPFLETKAIAGCHVKMSTAESPTMKLSASKLYIDSKM